MDNHILKKLANKEITKEHLFNRIKKDNNLIPLIVDGMKSDKAAIRYGCGKVLMEFSLENPKKLYSYFDYFSDLLESKYRILTWQAMDIIANLTKIDKNNKFENIFDKYYDKINDGYMVTVANLMGLSGKIAISKPKLINRITDKLLECEKLKTTPHLTEECKKVIAEKAISSFEKFFDKIENKQKVINFVKKYQNSKRETLKEKSKEFLKKWDK